jgi:hypothetical protein
MHSIPQVVAAALAAAALAVGAEQPVGFRGSEKTPVTVMLFSDSSRFRVRGRRR